MVTFDDLLEEAGSFGRCQKRIFALLGLLSLLFSGVYAGIVFQGFTPDHWCRDAAAEDRRQACGWSLAETAPLLNSCCERYELDWNATEATCDLRDLNLSGLTLTACKVSSTSLSESRSHPPAALCSDHHSRSDQRAAGGLTSLLLPSGQTITAILSRGQKEA